MTDTTAHPPIVSRTEWLTARKALLTRERELTKARDAVNAERRRLPMVSVDKTLRVRLAGRREDAARSVRRTPSAHRLSLHVRPDLGERLPGLHRLRRRAGRPVVARRARHLVRDHRACAARQAAALPRGERVEAHAAVVVSAPTSTTTFMRRRTNRSRRSSTTTTTRPNSSGAVRPDSRAERITASACSSASATRSSTPTRRSRAAQKAWSARSACST